MMPEIDGHLGQRAAPGERNIIYHDVPTYSSPSPPDIDAAPETALLFTLFSPFTTRVIDLCIKLTSGRRE